MASFKVIGVEQLNRLHVSLERVGERLAGEDGDRILTAGGEALAEYFKDTIVLEGLVDTGELLHSIKPEKPSNAGGKHVDVYPHGKRRDGKRNAEIGAYMEYGAPDRTPPQKSTPATHWMSNTVDDKEEEILDIVEAEILKIIDEI